MRDRPYSYGSVHSPQIFGCLHSRDSQREECHDFFEKYSPLKKNFKGHSFWARGYYVSTVGLDEAKIRKYIKDQEINDSVEDKYDSDLSAPF